MDALPWLEVWLPAAVVLTASLACVICAVVASRLAELRRDVRGLRQQVANIASMLIRAGYKRGAARDWSDNELDTQLLADKDPAFTWRKKD